jgi:hypothetical protein
MPLIKEKNRCWFCRLLSGKTLRPLREMFHATSATKPPSSPPLYNRTGSGIVNTMVPLQFSKKQEF